MIRSILFSAILLLTISSYSQTTDIKHFKGLKPRLIGPAGMSGRVTSIDVNPQKEDHILIGTAGGGVWESKNGGINWKPLFDDAPIQSIGAVAFDPSNPSVMWVGTGEGNPRNSQNSGKGIYRSIDAGKNWKLMGLESSKTIHRIIIDPRNSDRVYVASLGSAWGPNDQRGVFKTNDGGKTWDKILYVNDSTGCADLIMDPANPNKLIAAMWQYQRQPWFFTSGGKGSGLYISHDGGESWEKRTDKDGLPKGNLGRIGLASSANNPDVVYALVEAKKFALYKSTDGGWKWNKISDKNVGNRPFYYADIYADPTNEDKLYSLFSFVTKSTDGGRTFKGIAPYNRIHPDHHAFWINPKNGKHLIDGNDGGLAISKDEGKTWRYITNLPLGQFYHINIDNEVPYNVYGGLQDNGSWKGPAYLFESGGIRNHHWQELLFGDGFDVVPLKQDANQGYAMYQGGNVSRYNLNTNRTSSIKPVHPNGTPLRFNWNAAIAQDPFNDCGVYFGSQFVHYSQDCGNSWKVISPDLTTNDSTKQKQAKSGGLTIDATNAENYTTILAIEPSPLDSNVIWVGTDDGNLQLTTDGGTTWNNLSEKLSGCPSGSWIPQIHASIHSRDEVYVVVNDYRRNNWEPYVYRSVNGGNTFSRIVDAKKVAGHVWSIVQDPKVKDLLFCGTDQGLYVSFNGGNDWVRWTEGLPAAPVSDLKIQAREGDLVIGTFGRAIYVLDDIGALREVAEKSMNLTETKFEVFEPKTSIVSSWGNTKGIRFAADAEFKGQNRRSGVMFTMYIHPELLGGKDGKKDTTKKSGPQKVVEYLILNEEMDTLRFAKFKPDSMINRFYWDRRQDGFDYLTRKRMVKKLEEKKYKPGGIAVLPGTYKAVFLYKEFTDTVGFKIEQNPNMAKPETELKAAYDLRMDQQKRYNEVVEKVELIKEVKYEVGMVNKALQLTSDSIADSLKKEGKMIVDTVNAILDEFFLPEGFVGYDHVTVNLSKRISKIYGYIQSENVLENQGLQLAIKEFENAYKPVEERIDDLLNDRWVEYQMKVEQVNVDFFKKYKELRGK